MTNDIKEKILHILSVTHDGYDLESADLKLVELAANDFLNEAGIRTFTNLYYRLTDNKNG